MQAENSIEGVWEIVGIISQYGTFSENSFIPSQKVEELGQLGTFTFGEESVDFNFTRNDTMYSGSSSWVLDFEKVNAGFTKEPKFTLTITDHFLFDVFFEDGTKNSEKDAEQATFTATPSSGIGVQIEFSLEKN